MNCNLFRFKERDRRANAVKLEGTNALALRKECPCGDALRAAWAGAVLLKFLDFSNQESQAVARLRNFISPAPLTLLVFGTCETEE
jgi:hypothetical protein